jgi:hypothetical protein
MNFWYKNSSNICISSTTEKLIDMAWELTSGRRRLFEEDDVPVQGHTSRKEDMLTFL